MVNRFLFWGLFSCNFVLFVDYCFSNYKVFRLPAQGMMHRLFLRVAKHHPLCYKLRYLPRETRHGQARCNLAHQ